MSLSDIFTTFEKFPTTRFRVMSTIGLIIATGVVYLMHACQFQHPTTYSCTGWEPSVNWFMFLSALAGVDVSQYFVKNFASVKHAQIAATAANALTGSEPAEPEEDEDITASSDVSELKNNIDLKG